MFLLFWFFGDFRCDALLFMIIHVYINIKISSWLVVLGLTAL